MTIFKLGEAGVGGGGSSASPAVISYTSQGGNLLVVTGHLYDNNSGAFVAPTSITDSTAGTNVWHVSTNAAQTALTAQNPPLCSTTDPTDGASAHFADFVAWSFTTAAVTSVTIAWEGGVSTFQRLTVSEFPGAAAYSSSWAGGSTTASSSVTSGPVTVPAAGCLAVGALDIAAAVESLPSGWSAFTTQGTANDQGFVVNPATGPLSPVWTGTTAGTWGGGLAVFTPAAAFTFGAGGGTSPFTDPVFGGTWTATAGTGATLTDATTGGVTDGSGQTGCLQLSIAGKNQSSSSHWTWQGPWTDLGVPAGALVTSVQWTYSWSCSAFTTGASSSIGASGTGINNSSGVQQVADASTPATFAATTAYANHQGSVMAVPAAIALAQTTVQLEFAAALATGASSSAVVTVLLDNIRVVITWKLPPQVIAGGPAFPGYQAIAPQVITGPSVSAVHVSDSDSSSSADAGERITVVPAAAETGHGADAGEAVAATLSSPDSSGSADSNGGVTLASPETSTGGDGSEKLNVTGTGDSSSSADNTEHIAATLSSSDSSASADSNGVLVIDPAAGDTGQGSESSGSSATLTAADAGFSADSQGPGTVVPVQEEASSSADSQGLTATVPSGDSSSAADGTEVIHVSDSETSSSADNSNSPGTTTPKDGDFAHGEDSGVSLPVSSESPSCSDGSEVVLAAVSSSDSCSAADAAPSAGGTWIIFSSDSCSASDVTFSSHPADSDSAHASDGAENVVVPGNTVSDSDSCQAADKEPGPGESVTVESWAAIKLPSGFWGRAVYKPPAEKPRRVSAQVIVTAAPALRVALDIRLGAPYIGGMS